MATPSKELYDQQSEALNKIAVIVSETPGLAYTIAEPYGISNNKIPEGADMTFGINEAIMIEVWREYAFESEEEDDNE